MEYTVVNHTNTDTFTQSCESLLVNDWVPLGGVAVCYNERAQAYMLAQAFIRKEA
jgi:hypothetical protein